MDDQTKIRLSALEMELVKNSDWILTKNGIIQKTKQLLEQLQSAQQEVLKDALHLLPAEVTHIPPKISKGENYKGLPYLVLDYPRYFEKGNHFAIRIMFWWGNFFSITLHLSGIYKKMYAPGLKRLLTELKEEGLFICVNADEWEHHFEAGNYTPLQEMSVAAFNDCLDNKDFLKLAKMYPLNEWDKAGDALLASFVKLIKWLVR